MIIGGATSSSYGASYINAIARLVNTLLEVGRTIGSAIRYKTRGNYC
ncbi:MAG TPA: hypothetical protein PLC25_02130 [Bacilli bacterium]|nr:hypothetical protein [Bacilli bacterium]